MHDILMPPKLALAAAATSLTASLIDSSIPLFGVPLTAIGMAAAGATMSFAFGQAEKSRRRLFGVAIAGTFAGACGVTVVPAFLGLEWVSPVVQPPLAFFLAFFSRWIIPLLVDVLPSVIRRLFNQPPAGGQP